MIKWPSVGRIYIFLRYLEYSFKFASPIDRTIKESIGYIMTDLLKDFINFYFEFWSSMLFGGVQILIFFVSQQVYHGRSIMENLGFLTMFLVQWIVYTTFTHCIYSKVGLMVVELSIYKDGHEGLLNNLEEGLIILDQKTKELKFVNKAAKRYINKKPLSTSIE